MLGYCITSIARIFHTYRRHCTFNEEQSHMSTIIVIFVKIITSVLNEYIYRIYIYLASCQIQGLLRRYRFLFFCCCFFFVLLYPYKNKKQDKHRVTRQKSYRMDKILCVRLRRHCIPSLHHHWLQLSDFCMQFVYRLSGQGYYRSRGTVLYTLFCGIIYFAEVNVYLYFN